MEEIEIDIISIQKIQEALIKAGWFPSFLVLSVNIYIGILIIVLIYRTFAFIIRGLNKRK